jgi:hypothetical protein
VFRAPGLRSMAYCGNGALKSQILRASRCILRRICESHFLAEHMLKLPKKLCSSFGQARQLNVIIRRRIATTRTRRSGDLIQATRTFSGILNDCGVVVCSAEVNRLFHIRLQPTYHMLIDGHSRQRSTAQLILNAKPFLTCGHA